VIKLAIREWILNSGDKDDAKKFLTYIEESTIEDVQSACKELREYLESDSCGLNPGDKKMEEIGQELLSDSNAHGLPEGNSGQEKTYVIHEVQTELIQLFT
jgi:hypothetical protein